MDDELLFRVRALVGENPRRRTLAADECTDWPASFEEAEVELLSHVLAVVAVQEMDDAAQEAELNALCALADVRELRPGVLQTLRLLPRERLVGSSVERHQYLLGD
jgi:hypothetical protein